MTARILILNGHPDPVRKGLCHALADAYGAGAVEGGHEMRRLDIATLDFGFVHSPAVHRPTSKQPRRRSNGRAMWL